MKRRRSVRQLPSKSLESWVCQEHGVMLMEAEHGRLEWCPCCELGVEPRLDIAVGGKPLNDIEFRCRLSWPTLKELVPLMREYLARRKAGPMFVTVASWPKGEPLPMGYGESERFQNVLGYEWGGVHKFLLTEEEGRTTIENLRKYLEAKA